MTSSEPFIGSSPARLRFTGGPRRDGQGGALVLTGVAWAVYAAMVIATLSHHEPWADEAQAWLLARDASIWDLWTRLLHYEGSPGLWHTLIHALIHLGLPYSAFSYVPVFFAGAAAWEIARYSPFPLAIRLALPFTFFLGYQYAVVARSYDLLPLLLFAAAMIYPRAERRPAIFAAVLCLMGMLSVHGMILAVCIALSFAVFRWKRGSPDERRRMVWVGLICVPVALLVCAAAFPARDVTFVTHPKFSFSNWYAFSKYTVREAFTGEGISTAAVILLSLPMLWRGRGLAFFVGSTFALCTFGAVIYAAPWHQGTLLLAWLFALWISAADERLNNQTTSNLAWVAMAIMVSVQIYWTAASIRYDWKASYSAGKEAAQFLKNNGATTQGIYAVGYASTAIQPFFTSDFTGRGLAYWDWSNRNKTNDMATLLASKRRSYVIAGYKVKADQEHWARMMRISGYDLVHHFEGNLFWHTKVYEAESFDLYRLNPHDGNSAKFSVVAISNPAAADQLVSGFFDVEARTWRWTGKSFSMVLKLPSTSETTGKRITLTFFEPDIQIKTLGTHSIQAEVNGEALPAQTISREGLQEYSVEVPERLAGAHDVFVTFRLSKARPPTDIDSRELGLVIMSAGVADFVRR